MAAWTERKGDGERCMSRTAHGFDSRTHEADGQRCCLRGSQWEQSQGLSINQGLSITLCCHESTAQYQVTSPTRSGTRLGLSLMNQVLRVHAHNTRNSKYNVKSDIRLIVQIQLVYFWLTKVACSCLKTTHISETSWLFSRTIFNVCIIVMYSIWISVIIFKCR